MCCRWNLSFCFFGIIILLQHNNNNNNNNNNVVDAFLQNHQSTNYRFIKVQQKQQSFDHNIRSPHVSSVQGRENSRVFVLLEQISTHDGDITQKKRYKVLSTLKRPFSSLRKRFWKEETTTDTIISDTEVHVEVDVENESVNDDPMNKVKEKPAGDRWSISSEDVDFSGSWKPIVDNKFKKEYDDYLKCCGQNVIFRNLAKSVLGLVTEVIQHEGADLTIAGTTPAGTWTRTLVSSGTDLTHTEFEPIYVDIVDPDGDKVKVESFWQDDGQTHVSILRGKPRVQGGIFESRRYLLQDGDETSKLICESFFHASEESPSNKFQSSNVTWSFQKVSD